MRGVKPFLCIMVILTLALVLMAPKAFAQQGLQVHAPIQINGNSEFLLANGVTSGSGTLQDPYVIQGWVINASSSTGIQIQNTTDYFTIRDCLIESQGLNSFYGVALLNAENGVITNNTVLNGNCGIHLYASSNNKIEDNDINVEKSINLTEIPQDEAFNGSNNLNAIALYASSYDTVSNNTCENDYHTGIIVSDSFSINVTGNYCTNNHLGIFLQSTNATNVQGNVCVGNAYGVALDPDASGNVVSYNNGSSNDAIGIYLNSPVNNTVASNICTRNKEGIYLLSASYNYLIQNICSYNWYSIELVNSSNNIISGNIWAGNMYGNPVFADENSTSNSLSGNQVGFLPSSTAAPTPIAYDLLLASLIYTPILCILLAVYYRKPKGALEK